MASYVVLAQYRKGKCCSHNRFCFNSVTISLDWFAGWGQQFSQGFQSPGGRRSNHRFFYIYTVHTPISNGNDTKYLSISVICRHIDGESFAIKCCQLLWFICCQGNFLWQTEDTWAKFWPIKSTTTRPVSAAVFG